MSKHAQALTAAGIEFDPKASPAELKALVAHHKLDVPKEESQTAVEEPKRRFSCKVLVPRFEFAAGVAARGAKICLKDGDAQFHESRGSVRILGLK